MKEQRLQILRKVANGEMTPEQAHTELLVLSVVIGSSIPNPPEPPLSRVLREGVSHFCTNCGSTVSKDGFLGLFGEMLCHNEKCPNSKSKKNYR